MGHFISGVTASWSAVTLVPQLIHSYWIPPASFEFSSREISSALMVTLPYGLVAALNSARNWQIGIINTSTAFLNCVDAIIHIYCAVAINIR